MQFALCRALTTCAVCLLADGCWWVRDTPLDVGSCVPGRSVIGFPYQWLADGARDLPRCPKLPTVPTPMPIPNALDAFSNSNATNYYPLIIGLILLCLVTSFAVCFCFFVVLDYCIKRANQCNKDRHRPRISVPRQVRSILPVDDIELQRASSLERGHRRTLRAATPEVQPINWEDVEVHYERHIVANMDAILRRSKRRLPAPIERLGIQSNYKK